MMTFLKAEPTKAKDRFKVMVLNGMFWKVFILDIAVKSKIGYHGNNFFEKCYHYNFIFYITSQGHEHYSSQN